MSFGYIYKIVFPNGKHYIGLTTTSLEQRKQEHNRHAKRCDTRYLYNALRKYNMVDTFELIEIDTADTPAGLCEKEIDYIQKYNSFYKNGFGYNMTYGGDGTNGYVFTEENKQKISEAGKKYHKEHPEAGKEHGKKLQQHYADNADARQKQSENTKKQFETQEAREKHSEMLIQFNKDNPDAGKEHSERMKIYHEEHPEIGQKHSERMMQLLTTEDAREKCVAPLKQFHLDNPDARKEQGERRTQHFVDNPDAGKKLGESIAKHYINNPAARQKVSETQKKRFENPEERRKIADTKCLNKLFDVIKDGKIIKTFTYQFDAREYLQKEYNVTTDIKISEVLSGSRKSSAGFVFKYK